MAIKNKILISVILVSLFVHNSAFAGFELRKTTPTQPKVESKKVEDVEKEIIDAIISNKSETLIEKNEKTYIKTEADIKKEKDEQKIVTGFGQDLPLLISLQQIIPSDYQFSLANDVDSNLLTSWEGGRDWNSVLGDMLKAQNMSFEIKEKVVSIKKNPEEPKAEPAKSIAKELAPKVAKEPVKEVQKTKIISNKRQPKIKEVKAKAVPKYEVKKYEDTSKSDDPNSPINIISSENTPIKVDDSMKPFFDEGAMVNQNDPLASAKWIGLKNQTLREVLTDWCKKEGVELYWTIDYDYKLNKNIAFLDEYEIAVAKLFDIFRDVRPQPYGQLHQGDRGPLVLVVNSYDLAH